MSGYDFRDACESGDLDKVKGLIKDVDINETDEYGFTGLHLAAEHGHLKIVEELMVVYDNIWLIDEVIYSRLLAASLTLWCLTATTFPSTRL